jgi:diguanylate cyclase (GGDEF)-like protein/PAS domain S-box-containing protein
MRPFRRERLAGTYVSAITAVGATALLYSLSVMPFPAAPAAYLLLLLLTAVVSGRGIIRIPGVKGHISVADSFVFLTMLLFGGEAAVLVAAFEGLYCSYTFKAKTRTALFNAAAVGLSTFVTASTLRLLFGREFPPSSDTASYVIAICVMAVTQYAMNSTIIAAAVALRAGQSLWDTWREKFLWTSVTYIGGAAAAGVIAKMVEIFGFYATLALGPVVAIVYFTYVTYLRNVEISAAQAEQAARHVEELSHHLAEQDRISRKLRESEEQFRSAFDGAAVGMILISPAGEITKANDAFCRLVERTRGELPGLEFLSLTHPDDAATVSRLLRLLLGVRDNAHAEVRLLDANGEHVWAAVSLSLVHDLDGEPLRFIAQVQDIRERKRAEEALRSLSMVDELTGLYNRRGFLTFAAQHVGAAHQLGRRLMLFYADLDDLKQINDCHGHQEGDCALEEAARLLRATFRESDVVARLGGDEFAVLAEVSTEGEALMFLSRLMRKLDAANQMPNRVYSLSMSVGFACLEPATETTIERLMAEADMAMYANKRRKKSLLHQGSGGLAGTSTASGEARPMPLEGEHSSDVFSRQYAQGLKDELLSTAHPTSFDASIVAA